MRSVCFLDIREGEVRRYTIEVKGNRCAVKERRVFPSSDLSDIPAGVAQEGVETVYVSIPLSAFNFRILELPFSDKERIRQVLPFELDGMILGGVASVIFDAVVMGKTDGGYQILAAYVEKDRLRELLDRLTSVGVDPMCITSLEVRHALRGFSPSKLVPPLPMTDEEREASAVAEVKEPTMNVRRDEFAFTRGREKMRRSLRVTALLISLLVLVVGVDVAFRIVTARQEIASLRQEIRKAYLDLFPGDKTIVNEVHQTKAQLKELRGREEIYVGVKPLDVLTTLARIGRDGVKFYEVSVERGKVVLRGEADSLSSVQQTQGKLSEHFEGVSIAASETSVQGTTAFTITAREREK